MTKAMAVAERVKSRRKAKRLSQQQLAKKAGYDLKTIYRMEKGEQCSVSALKRVGEALGIDPTELVDDTAGVVRRRPVTRMRDGQQCIQLLVNSTYKHTALTVERDAEDEAVDAAILKICDLVDSLRKHDESKTPTRDQHEFAKKLSQALKDLEGCGWLMELHEEEQDVSGTVGVPWDLERYFRIHLRPATAQRREGAAS